MAGVRMSRDTGSIIFVNDEELKSIDQSREDCARLVADLESEQEVLKAAEIYATTDHVVDGYIDAEVRAFLAGVAWERGRK